METALMILGYWILAGLAVAIVWGLVVNTFAEPWPEPDGDERHEARWE